MQIKQIHIANARFCTREEWIDRWRGILMICIVAFHVVGAMMPKCTDTATDVAVFLQNQFATFHTRGFFVLSGMLFHPGVSWRVFFISKCKRLLVPYFIFGFAWAALFCVGGNYFSGVTTSNNGTSHMLLWKPFVSVLLANGWPEGMGFRVINVLWFLPCLFLVEILYFWVDKAISNKYWQLALLPVCYALNGCFFKPDIFWSLNLVPRFIACFIIGRVFFNREKIHVNRAALFFIAAALICLTSMPHIVAIVATFVGLGQWSDLIRGVCGVIACALFAQSIQLRVLSIVGCSTMGVLVTHKAFIMMMQMISFQLSSWVSVITVIAGCTLFATAASILSTLVLRRFCPWILGEVK